MPHNLGGGGGGGGGVRAPQNCDFLPQIWASFPCATVAVLKVPTGVSHLPGFTFIIKKSLNSLMRPSRVSSRGPQVFGGGGSPSLQPHLHHQKGPQHVQETPKVLMGLLHLPGLVTLIKTGLNI